jgi:hypothetical protein
MTRAPTEKINFPALRCRRNTAGRKSAQNTDNRRKRDMLTYDAIAAAQEKYQALMAVKARPEIEPVTVIEPGLFSRISAEIKAAVFTRKPAARPANSMRRSLATK